MRARRYRIARRASYEPIHLYLFVFQQWRDLFWSTIENILSYFNMSIRIFQNIPSGLIMIVEKDAFLELLGQNHILIREIRRHGMAAMSPASKPCPRPSPERQKRSRSV